MKRGLSLLVAATFLASPYAASAQQPTTAPADTAKTNETQPSQGAAAPQAPAPAAKPAPPAPPKAELYGTINVNMQWTRANNATGLSGTAADIAPRAAISTDSSNIGVRGGLQATDWLKAEYQCETSAAIDGFSVSGICNRNSKVGVAGTYGSLFYGNWDTPFKSLAYGTEGDDPFGNTDVWDMEAFMGSPGFRTRAVASKTDTFAANAAFSVRAANIVSYWTPKFYGVGAKFMYGVNESKSLDGRVSPKLWSANIVYDNGPFSIGGAYELHEDSYGLAGFGGAATRGGFSGTAAAAPSATNHYNSEDRAWRVMAGYELKLGSFGATTIGAMFEQLEYINLGIAAGQVKSYDRYAWQASLKHRVGNHELRARFNSANDGACEIQGNAACNANGYGATALALGYAYHLAKTTQVYLHWIDIRNDTNATYTMATAGPAPAPSSNAGTFAGSILPGQDPQSLGLGVRHAF